MKYNIKIYWLAEQGTIEHKLLIIFGFYHFFILIMKVFEKKGGDIMKKKIRTIWENIEINIISSALLANIF